MRKLSICLALAALCAVSVKADTINLGAAGSFAVLATSTVTNTGPSVINGDLGLSPGTSITGFGPGTVTAPYTIHDTDAVASGAETDAKSAYGVLAGLSPTGTLTGQDLGGLTLTPGVYFFANSAQLTGPLTLNAEGLSDAVFVFQIGSTLTTASASSVLITNPGENDSVFWQVGSSATLGTTTAFVGNILADQSITLNTGATITCGSALALDGAVTLDTNTVSVDNCQSGTGGGSTPVPEPGTFVLFGSGITWLAARMRRALRRNGSAKVRC